MPTLKIDGKVCAYEGKKSVLQVALDNGIEIPHYCYHPGMSVVASCRICLMEMATPDPKTGVLNHIPKLIPACQTPAADGAEVYLTTPKVIGSQKAVMEQLLINHPLDCPVCDQAGECSLQDYSYRYGKADSRFEEAKNKKPKKDIGEHVLLYSDRCIMCSRCVRFTREVTGTHELGIFGRGSSEQVDIAPGQPLNNPMSGNVVDVCPVGALLDKDFLMTMRVWNLRKTASIDGLTASGDNLSIETNEGKVYRVKPRTNLEVNKWWTSDEIRYGWKFVHSEDRLREPSVLLNVEDSVEPRGTVDWAEAYAGVLEGLRREMEGGRLGLVVSPMLSCEEAYLLGQLALSLDPQAVLAVGPVPRQGEDKTFPGGYTIHAEKAPNARGVRRALEALAGSADRVLSFDAFLARQAQVKALILTGNYPSAWATAQAAELVAGRFTVLLDTLPCAASKAANIVLPTATWLEKAGCFENVGGRIQSFEAAIPALEMTRSEGQVALDLLALSGTSRREIFDAAKVREAMGGAFMSDVKHPAPEETRVSEVEYAAL